MRECSEEDKRALRDALAPQVAKRWTAAVALAKLGAREHVPAIVRALQRSRSTDAAGYCVALEIIGDPSVVPALIALVQQRDPQRAWTLNESLQALAKRQPLVDRWVDPAQYANAVAEAWARPPLAEPTLAYFRSAGPTEAAFAVDHGQRAVSVRYVTSPGDSWPRWTKGLYVDDTLLYDTSSDCGTCETILRLAGALRSNATLDAYRSIVDSLTQIDRAALVDLWPLVARLASGHYLASLADVPIERVDDPQRSWLSRRYGDGPSERAAHNSPATPHFQGRFAPSDDEKRALFVLAPSQRLDALDDERVRAFERAIVDGARPAAIALTWVEDRPSDALWTWGVRSLLGFVLDGHHKLAAYARVGVPARILSLASVELSSTGEIAPERAVREALALVSTPC